MKERSRARHLVLFDGVCGLCNRAVSFLLARDRAADFLFAPLDGKTAAGLEIPGHRPADSDTLVLIENWKSPQERVSTRSTAVLRTLARLGGLWNVVSWLRVVPGPVRDLLYRGVARYRYRWFGKLDHCPLPPADARSRFLE